MAKHKLPLEEERRLKKNLKLLLKRLLDEVDAGKTENEQAMAELSSFFAPYGMSPEKDPGKAFLDATMQQVQMDRFQAMGSYASAEEGESSSDAWPPPEPNDSNNSKKSK